jgi:hypothetical protein
LRAPTPRKKPQASLFFIGRVMLEEATASLTHLLRLLGRALREILRENWG